MTPLQFTFLVLVTFTTNAIAASSDTATPRQDEVRSAPERIATDTRHTTMNGATFTIPAGWSIIAGRSTVILEPPELDTHIAIIDSAAADAAAAVGAAWKSYKPGAIRPLTIVNSSPARNGWDERQVFNYEVSPNERLFVRALALRSGSGWTVVIMDGGTATWEKRSASIILILQSLRAPGYQRESFAGRKSHPLDSASIAQLKQFVESSMQKLGIPGAAVALVDRGKIVFEGGFGVRELGKPPKVNANTLFMAASNTKALTTLLLAELVDEKKLRWDQPVTEVYPGFKLGDPDTTRQVLVKHLVCACTGLPRQDLESTFEFKDSTPATSLALLGTMKPTTRFGETFQYNNLMAAAAGYIGASLVYPTRELGAAYDEAMKKMIFDPLGMTSTTFDMARAQRGNHASPHGDDVDRNPAVGKMAFNYAVVPHRPAGGAWTSAHDLIRYVQLELALGNLPNGKRLVSPENIVARRMPQISVSESAIYGMGLMIDNTWGVPVVSHGGSMSGYKSDIYFLPDAGVGAVLLTNADNGQLLLRPFIRRLLEVIFDGKVEAAEDLAGQVSRHKAIGAKERKRLMVPADPIQVAKLSKRYKSTELGELTVLRDKSVTVFDFGEWKSAVASRINNDGTVSFIAIDPASPGSEFIVSERIGKRALIIRDRQHEYVFVEER